jgi:hypothetical protein
MASSAAPARYRIGGDEAPLASVVEAGPDFTALEVQDHCLVVIGHVFIHRPPEWRVLGAECEVVAEATHGQEL